MSSLTPPAGMLPLLKEVSRSFYLSIRFLPKPMRQAVALGYLLARATDTVADASTEDPLERVRLLERMNDAVEGKRDTALAAELMESVREVDHAGERKLLGQWEVVMQWMRSLPESEEACVRRVIQTIVAGQISDVQRFEIHREGSLITSLPDREALNTYTYSVAGCVGRFWTEVAVASLGERAMGPRYDTQCAIGERFGQGLQMINILRDLSKDSSLGRCYLPLDWQNEMRVSMVDSPAELWQKADVWRGLCSEWVAAGREYAAGMRGIRLRFTAMLPALLADATLEKLNDATWEELEAEVKVTRSEVKAMVGRALWFAIFGRRV